MSDNLVFYKGLKCTKLPRAPRASRPLQTGSKDLTSSLLQDLSSDSTPTLLPDITTLIGSALGDTLQSFTGDTTRATKSITNDVSSLSITGAASNTSPAGRAQDHSTLSFPIGGSPGSLSLTSLQTLVSGAPFSTSLTTATGAPGSGIGSSDTSDSVPSDPHAGKQPAKRVIVGSILGSLSFLSLVLLIGFVIYRRRPMSHNKHGHSANEKLLHSGRRSADSSTSLQCSDTSQLGYPQSNSQEESSSRNPFADPPTAQTPTVVENPFSSPDDHSSGDQSMTEISSLSVPAVSGHPSQSEPEIGLFRTVPYQPSANVSQQSLGSTIILPGRSSLGSSLHGRNSYHAPPTTGELDPSKLCDSIRTSTHSDPFDLEPPHSVQN
ncbi:hypothetical protein PHISCL_07323 [Aspergillus sclerotialis]|uniref:Uncharacterized protein n=1 Tax=Aspergillus sclerotialis TaxID=2070753 RepID=A0A3A2ZB54_9EURO|nr:hypothetical protein PHISCL_07323 [Aspergillus sclerotialis]